MKRTFISAGCDESAMSGCEEDACTPVKPPELGVLGKPETGMSGVLRDRLFRQLVQEHRQRLHRFILKNIGHADDAEDLVQQAFLEASRSYATYRGESALSTWLYGIAMNLTRNYLSRSPQRKYDFVDGELLEDIAAEGALGAILAERFGYQIAFVACASTYVAAAMLCWKMRFDGNGQADTETSSLRALGDFLRQRDALAVTILAAVPARLLAAAVLILMAPLYLFEAGESTTVVGRVLPLYFVGFLVAAPGFASYSDRSGRHKSCVVAGCVLSGIGCAAVPWIGGVVGAGIGCVLLGLGQAALSAPQLAWVVDLCAHRGHAAVEQGVAAFRFLERVGSVAAAPVVALCVQGVGLSSGFAALGGGVALAGLALLLLRTPFGRDPGIGECVK